MPLAIARIQALCFDIDGTLADTDDHIVEVLAAGVARLPLVSGRRAERVARQVVMGGAGPVNAAYGWLDRRGLDGPFYRLKQAARRLRAPARTRNPRAADEVPHEMMPGVKEMLATLSARYPMCTISTGGQARVEQFLAHYGVLDCFKAVVTAQTTELMKPHPDPLLFAAHAMGVPAEACLMIGDTTVDVATAQAAGAQSVAVLCGFGTEDELVATGADLVLETTSDLLAVLMPEEDPLHRSAMPGKGEVKRVKGEV